MYLDKERGKLLGVLAGISTTTGISLLVLRTVFILIVIPWIPFIPINTGLLFFSYMILGLVLKDPDKEVARNIVKAGRIQTKRDKLISPSNSIPDGVEVHE